jgi:choline dehydrogenase
LYCINNPRTDWLYRTEPDAGLNGRSLIYPRGKVLGGCSSINGMIYMRGQSRDYDHWADLTGDDSWRWDNVLPFFKKTEDHYKGAAPAHGAGGEWRVEQQRLSWEILDAFQAAALQCGIPNTAGRPNLEIMTGCQVRRLRTQSGPQGLVCSGVEFVGGGSEWFAESTCETILAAGAIGSPQILQLSGIGPADLLQQHAVPLVLDLPGVGENLQDHLQIRSAFKIQGAKTLNMMAGNWFGKMKIGVEYALFQRGPMSMAPSQLGAFTKSDPGQASANLEYHVQPLSLEKFGEPLHPFPAFTASVCNLRPTSRGHVRIGSGLTTDAPKITPNYLSTQEDRKIAASSLTLTRNIVAAPALRKYAPEELKPGAQFRSEEELARAAGDIGTTIFHPVGTCKMGRSDDPLAVLDSQLRVRGIGGLRVVDASVMPTITSGNTNSPTIMIAEKAAAWIRADRHCK